MTVTYDQYNYIHLFTDIEHGYRFYLRVTLTSDSVFFRVTDPDGETTFRLPLSDARILRDVLTEHIARQDRKPA